MVLWVGATAWLEEEDEQVVSSVDLHFEPAALRLSLRHGQSHCPWPLFHSPAPEHANRRVGPREDLGLALTVEGLGLAHARRLSANWLERLVTITSDVDPAVLALHVAD